MRGVARADGLISQTLHDQSDLLHRSFRLAVAEVGCGTLNGTGRPSGRPVLRFGYSALLAASTEMHQKKHFLCELVLTLLWNLRGRLIQFVLGIGATVKCHNMLWQARSNVPI